MSEEIAAAGSPLSPSQPPPNPQNGSTYQPNPADLLKSHEAKTARALTFGLLSLLGFSVAAQYAALGILVWKNRGDAIPNFEHLFNAWLPVIAGLSSSAVTYYLTKDKK